MSGEGSAAARDFGSQLPQIVVPPPGPASRDFAARLRRVESRNLTYVSDEWPVFWEAASGSNVRDADQNVYIDAASAFGVALLGHAPPAVRTAVEHQLGSLVHGMGDVHPPVTKLELLEELTRLAPWSDAKAILASSGSEAVEAALKTAAVATGRSGIVAFEGGYHGLTVGSLSVTERPHFRERFLDRLYDGVAFAPFPDPVRDGDAAADQSIAAVRNAFERGAPDGSPIGTVIIEPVQARGGARVPPDGFMADLTALAREHEIVVVADEIMTGFGRCGSIFASSLVGLEPDIVTVGKALGGGLPISACIAPARVMDCWPESDGEAIHTSTFLGHPIACAAALAVLKEIDATDVPGSARILGSQLLDGLQARLDGRDEVADIRGLGLLLGVELDTAGRALPVAEDLLRRGVIALPAGADGSVLELTPPATLTDEQVAYVVDAIGAAVEATG